MARQTVFEEGRCPWPLHRIAWIEAATSGQHAAVQVRLKANGAETLDQTIAIAFTLEQAIILADLLGEAIALLEASQMPPLGAPII